MNVGLSVLAPRVNANDDSVRLIRWLVEPGAWVDAGSPIAEIETTKAVVEVETEHSGYFAPELTPGDVIAVGELMARLVDKYDPADIGVRKRSQPLIGEGRLISRGAAKLMEEHGLRPQDCPGTEPIRRVDVERVLANRIASPDTADWDASIAALSPGPDGTVVFGADLQGSVVIECLEAARPASQIVLVDDRPQRKHVLGRPVLPAALLPQLHARGFRRAHVAISTPAAKLACAARLKQAGFEIVEVRHPSAVVSPSAQIGEGCFFGPLTLIGPECKIGAYVQINNAASVAHHSQVEEAARLSDGVRIAGRVSIGERTFIGLGVTVNEKISIGRETVIVSGVHIFNHVPDDAIVRIDGKVYARRT